MLQGIALAGDKGYTTFPVVRLILVVTIPSGVLMWMTSKPLSGFVFSSVLDISALS
jgi:hypothetical protein